MTKSSDITYNFFSASKDKILETLGAERLKEAIKKMCLIRQFESRAESAYQQGKIGGFFHAYTGQEAIQTACVDILGMKPWYTTTYRCHALALLTGATPNELMSELYGKVNGNAKGRGGSMHLYSERLLGGFGIVGGHLPIAMGAAFSLKYKNEDSLSVCFLGDGAMVQGAFHESLNLAALWDLPALVVIENNQWGMGTAVSRAVCNQPIAESFAKGYDIESYSVNGMDYFDCYGCFQEASEKILKTKRPILIEAVTERFKGHSISDPGLYRSKENLDKVKANDPIKRLKDLLMKKNLLSEEEFKAIVEEQKEIVKNSMKHAEESPWPELSSLEEGVFSEHGL